MVRFISTSLLALTLTTAGTASMAQPVPPPPCHGEHCDKFPPRPGEPLRHDDRRDHDRRDAPWEQQRDHDQRRDHDGRHDNRRDHDDRQDPRRDHDGRHDERRQDGPGYRADRDGDQDRGEHRGNDHCKPGDRNCKPSRPN
ncbi:hypothetical protein [Falsirhodobacter sp. 1013]|uniref:hypothetical protein n=1 Tax=Falsirhodobacter sp. 1013 TaxID=3417566 RepID=UPI003EBFC851